jgi:hypothetical protein
MEMRYHWLTERVRQKQFDVYWRPGRDNLGEYHTKHHSAQHHKYMCGLIIHQAKSFSFCKGAFNYSHSLTPTYVRAHMHTHIRVLREPHRSQ